MKSFASYSGRCSFVYLFFDLIRDVRGGLVTVCGGHLAVSVPTEQHQTLLVQILVDDLGRVEVIALWILEHNKQTNGNT